MKLSTKHAYDSRFRILNSVLSTMIACDFTFFSKNYSKLMDVNQRINHKGYLQEVVQNKNQNSVYNFI